jgi:hypothetical protein
MTECELTSLVAEVLVVNSRFRAPSIYLQSPPSQSASFSLDRGEDDVIRSVESHAVAPVQQTGCKVDTSDLRSIKKCAKTSKEVMPQMCAFPRMRRRGNSDVSQNPGTRCRELS